VLLAERLSSTQSPQFFRKPYVFNFKAFIVRARVARGAGSERGCFL